MIKYTIFQLKEAFAGTVSERNSALKALYKQHFSPVRKMVIQNEGAESQAFQIFEEALIALYEQIRHHPEKFEGNPNMRDYLYTLSREIWERENKRKVHVNTINSKEMSVASVSRLLPKENRSVLNLIWGQLKEDCHQVLIHAYFDLFSPSESGRRTGLGDREEIERRKEHCFNYLKQMIKRTELRER